MDRIFANRIGDEWRRGADSRPNINPSDTGEVIGHYARGGAQDVTDAVAAARAAFPAWSRFGPMDRHAILMRASADVTARGEQLATLLAREKGKTLADARGEVGRVAQIRALHATEAVRRTGETGASIRTGVSVEITREPVGVVGIITP